MPESVPAPDYVRTVGGGPCVGELSNSFEIGFPGGHRRDRFVWEIPSFRGGDVESKEFAGKKGVDVGVDEAGQEHFSREAAIDTVGQIGDPGFKGFDGSDIDDEAVANGDSGRLGLAGFHRDDLARDVDNDLALGGGRSRDVSGVERPVGQYSSNRGHEGDRQIKTTRNDSPDHQGDAGERRCR